MIRTKYINDLTTTPASLTFQSTTLTAKSSPIWSSFLTTLLSLPPSETITSKMITATTTITSTTTATPTTVITSAILPTTTAFLETIPFTSSTKPEQPSSSTPNTTVEKQFTPSREKLPSWWRCFSEISRKYLDRKNNFCHVQNSKKLFPIKSQQMNIGKGFRGGFQQIGMHGNMLPDWKEIEKLVPETWDNERFRILE